MCVFRDHSVAANSRKSRGGGVMGGGVFITGGSGIFVKYLDLYVSYELDSKCAE